MQPRWAALAVNAGLAVAVLLTIAGGFVVGYGAVSLQFFGETADSEDYQVSAGGYAAAAVALGLGVAAVLGYARVRWPALLSAAAAAVYLLLAARSAWLAASSTDPGFGINTAWDGVGGVLGMPWTWPLLLFGLTGAVRLVRHGPVRQPVAHGSGTVTALVAVAVTVLVTGSGVLVLVVVLAS